MGRISTTTKLLSALTLAAIAAATAAATTTANQQSIGGARKFDSKRVDSKRFVISSSAPRAAKPAMPRKAAAGQAQESSKPFMILYDSLPCPSVKSKLDAAGATQYFMVYQNIDPMTAQTGKIDASKIIAYVKQNFGDNPSGWGMLDYEVPFDTVIHQGPSSPQYQLVVSEMVNAIKTVKQAFPNVKWTYYGIPGLSYWPGGAGWSDATPAAKQAEIDKQITNYGPVLKELDWYSPCVYDIYRLDAFTNPVSKAKQAISEPMYRQNRVGVVKEFLKRNNLPARPIMPSVTPFFAPGGNAVENAVIPESELLSDQIRPLLEAGCDGVAIWTCGNYYVKLATQPTNNSETQVRLRTVYRTDFLGGNEPANWTAPALKETLNTKVGAAVARMAELTRAESKVVKEDKKVAGQSGG